MRFVLSAIWVAWLVVTPMTSWAQQVNPYGAKAAPKIELDGKLQAWQGGMMRIMTSSGQPLLFALPQSPNGIRFIAEVDQGALKRGMFVRIQAPATSTGQFLESVNALTIFVPDRSKMNAKMTPQDRSMQMPGVYRVAQLQRTAPGEMGSPDVRIVGSILGIESNMLALQVGNGPMKVELAESPKIELNTSSLEYAKPGDSVTGSAMLNPATNQLGATNITVRAAKPIKSEAPPTTVAAESMKLRVKEKAKSKLKSPEMKEDATTTEKPEMKLEGFPSIAPESEKPAAENPETGKSPVTGENNNKEPT